MKVLFVCRGNRTQTSADILRALKQLDPLHAGIALTIYEDKWFSRLSEEDQGLFEQHYTTEDIYTRIRTRSNAKHAAFVTRSYREGNFWNHAFSERYLAALEHFVRFVNPRYDRNELLAYGELCVEKFTNILDNERPDLILDFSPLGFMRAMLHLVASERQIPYKWFMLSRLTGYSIFTDLYDHGVSVVAEHYARIVATPEASKVDACRIIQDFSERNRQLYVGHHAGQAEKSDSSNRGNSSLTSIPRRVLRFCRALLREVVLRLKAVYDPSISYNYYLYLYFPSKRTVDGILRNLRYRRFFRWWRKCRHDEGRHIADSARLFLFTMHVQPEASTSVHAPFFCNQEYVIQNICRALPPDGLLLVKPHIHQIRAEPLSLYKRLARIPNLVLVSPLRPTREYLQTSEAAITITGTVGLEAIILGKKAITFAETLYSSCKSVTVMRDFEKLKEYLYSGPIGAADEEDVQNLVQAIIDASIETDEYVLRNGPGWAGADKYALCVERAAAAVHTLSRSLDYASQGMHVTK